MPARKINPKVRFAICLAADPEEDLEAGKVYRVLKDQDAAEVACLRVVDESGEDYLYPASRFVMVDIPDKTRSFVESGPLDRIAALGSQEHEEIIRSLPQHVREEQRVRAQQCVDAYQKRLRKE